MPNVQKQTPKNRPTPTSKSDDILSRISPIGFSADDGIKILLYGQSGSGKTTLWSTFPKDILAIVCSGSDKPGELRSIDTPELREHVHQFVVNTSKEIFKLIDYQKTEDRYKTIVLDHATGLQDKILSEILGVEQLPAQSSWGMATQQQYGQCTLQCKELLRALLSLSCNVVIVAQEREFNNDGESDLIAPFVGAGLTPSLTGWLNTAVDYICQTHKRQKETIKKTKVGDGANAKVVETRKKLKGVDYCLRTGPDPVYTTKFRVPRGSSPLPDFVTDPSFDKIIKLIRPA